MFKKIVVGIDYSEASKKALLQAKRIARGEGSELVALHVVAPSELEEYQRYYTIPTDEMLKAFRTGLEDIVEAELGARDAAKCEVVIDVPYHGLTKFTEKNGSDLLVLGSRGKSADAHAVGYFAAKCVRHSKAPVLLTRIRHGDPFKRVIACVDFSAATQEVIETAARLATDEGGELHLVHAICPPWMRPTHVLYNLETVESKDDKAQFEELLGEQMQAAARWAKPFDSVNVSQHVLQHSNPIQALVNFLSDHDADLAVVGRSGHTATAIKHFLLGTMAERLIHRSPCSVITVPCESHE